jgi:hypothetical protein
MTIDYQGVLYNPIYGAVAVEATLSSSAGVEVTVAVVDKTAGVVLSDRMNVESIRPVARVRTAELVANDVEMADLPNSLISFNGASWRIKAYRQMPAPTGEMTGETMLILLSEGEA